MAPATGGRPLSFRAAGRARDDCRAWHEPRGGAGGGEGIPASRPPGAAIAAGAAAVAVALASTVWLAADASSDGQGVVLLIGLVATALTAVALVWPLALGFALVASAGAYAALLAVDEPPLDTRPVGVSAALVAVGELVGWARELASSTRDEPGGAWRRPIWIAGAAVVALGLSWAVLALVDAVRVEGLAYEAVGALAALAALVVVWRIAAERRP